MNKEKVNALSEEEVRKFLENLPKIVKGYIKKHTPLLGNKCHCGGEVVRKAYGFSHRRVHYSAPECIKCGRPYQEATGVRKVGGGEFLENLRGMRITR